MGVAEYWSMKWKNETADQINEIIIFPWYQIICLLLVVQVGLK